LSAGIHTLYFKGGLAVQKGLQQELYSRFSRQFPGNDLSPRFYFSPGRITIVGEHVEQYGGNVLSATINRGIYAVAAPANEPEITCYSDNLKEICRTPSSAVERLEPLQETTPGLQNILDAAVKALTRRGRQVSPHNIYLSSNLPAGVGLASSAALLLLLLKVLNDPEHEEIDGPELAELAYHTSKEFFPGDSSYTDIYTIACSKPENFVLSNTHLQKQRLIKALDQKLQFCLLDPGVKREKFSAELLERKTTLDRCLRKLQTFYPKIKMLAELSIKDLQAGEGILNEIEQKRTMHVVSECQRVHDIVIELRNRDFFSIGVNLFNSHISLKNDFNISCNELDWLVEAVKDVAGVFGATLCGGGAWRLRCCSG
jgi:galactokinase